MTIPTATTPSTEGVALYPAPADMARAASLVYVGSEHPGYVRVRRGKGFRLLPFAEALPDLRSQVDADLRGRSLTWNKVAAIAVDLLDKTRLRVGNPEYQRQNESYGLTTFQDEHVDMSPSAASTIFIPRS